VRSPTHTTIREWLHRSGLPIETILAELATRPDGLTQIEADRQLLRFAQSQLRSPQGHSVRTPAEPVPEPAGHPPAVRDDAVDVPGETTDAVIVLAIVLGSACSASCRNTASNEVAKLLAVIQTRVRVLRDGREIELPQSALVPAT